MKYNWETTQKETQGFLSLIEKFMTLIEKGQSQKYKIDKERLKLEREKLEWEKQKWEDDEDSEDDSEDEDSEWERPEPFLAFDAERKKKKKTKKVHKVWGKSPIKEETKKSFDLVHEAGHWGEINLTDHQKLGKKIMGEVLEKWLINWGKEGQQPNRFEILHDLAIDSKRGGALVSYCMAVKGLSTAVHNVLVLQDPDADPQRSRNIAGNITQVASTVFSQLADQYKYPNPLQNYITPTKEAKNESI